MARSLRLGPWTNCRQPRRGRTRCLMPTKEEKMSDYPALEVKVWGDFACFTRPEMKVERVSYDVITPSAARGVLEAIFWKPQIRWVIDCIHVLNPIRFTN